MYVHIVVVVLLSDIMKALAYFGVVGDATAVANSETSRLVPDSRLPRSAAKAIGLMPSKESLSLKQTPN